MVFHDSLGFPGSPAGKGSACHAGDPGSILGLGNPPGEVKGYSLQYSWSSLVPQMVKNLPAVWETWVRSLAWEDPLEEDTPVFLPGESHGQRSRGITVHGVIKSWRRLSDEA